MTDKHNTKANSSIFESPVPESFISAMPLTGVDNTINVTLLVQMISSAQRLMCIRNRHGYRCEEHNNNLNNTIRYISQCTNKIDMHTVDTVNKWNDA